MPWQNTPGGGNKNPGKGPGKNPWGTGGGSGGGDKGGNGGGPRNPWGGGGNNNGGGGNGGEPPDIDDMLRKAQANLRQVLPGFGDRHNGSDRMAMLAVAAIVAIWLLSGFYIINPGESGVIQRFGKLDRTQVEEGLGYHMPWPVEKITTVDVSHVRSLPIGFAGRDQMPSDVTPDTADESLILTSDANIIDLDFVVLWNIKSAEAYLFNIDHPENTIKKVAESAIREVVGQTLMLDIIINGKTGGAAGDMAEQVRKIMQENLDDYKSGIAITQVTIQKAEVHPDVQPAFQDVQSAKQDAETAKNQARTYTEDIVNRSVGVGKQRVLNAEAYREAAIARATGEAKRFESLSESYKLGPEVTRTRLYMETMENVLSHAQTTILDSKGTSVLPYLPSQAEKAAPATTTAPAVNGRATEIKP